MVFTAPKEAPAPRVIRDADMVEMVKLSGTADKVLTALAIGREKSAFAFEPDKWTAPLPWYRIRPGLSN